MKVKWLFLSAIWLFSCLNASEFPIQRIHFKEMVTQNFAKDFAQEFLDIPGKWVVVTADQIPNNTSNGTIHATFITLRPKNLSPIIPNPTSAIIQTLNDFQISSKPYLDNLFVNGKKIASCVYDFIPHYSQDYEYLLITITLNVNTTLEELPTQETSMYVETLKNFDKDAILIKLSGHL